MDTAKDELIRLLSKAFKGREIAVAAFINVEGAFNYGNSASTVHALTKKGLLPSASG